jgi:hypothetical protein
MKLAFDVRLEWEQLWARLNRRAGPEHWLTIELQRSVRGSLDALAGFWRGIDVCAALRVVRRRIVWGLPRVNVRLLCELITLGLVASLLTRGMRTGPVELEMAKGAVPMHVPVQVDHPKAQAAIEPPPAPPKPAVEAPPRRLSAAEILAQRKADLVEAQQQCLRRLEGTPPYESAKAHFDQIDQRVKALRRDDPFRDLPRASVEWIQAKSELQKVIDEAMRADPQVVRARATLDASKRPR